MQYVYGIHLETFKFIRNIFSCTHFLSSGRLLPKHSLNCFANMSANGKLQKVRASRDRLVLRCSGSLFLLRISVRYADSTHRCIPEPFLMSYKHIRLCQIALHSETWNTDGQSRCRWWSGVVLKGGQAQSLSGRVYVVYYPQQHHVSTVWQPFLLKQCYFYQGQMKM